jgi:hypothetical protein
VPASLRWLLLVTDWGFVVYWSVTALAATGVIAVPTEWMFRNHSDPVMVAWNWSFLPLDLAASVLGLLAVRAGGAWKGLATVSLALTSCAGLMAVSFWAISGDFDPSWWGPNLFLLLWPWIFLPGLMRG